MSLSPNAKKFVSSEDGEEFEDLVRSHYKGFVHIPARELKPSSLYNDAKKAFEMLRDANYYHYDVVMAGGKRCSRTFVKRTLVGCPGITYKYLSLRLFSHPWSGTGCCQLMKNILSINQRLVSLTKQYDAHGESDYNLTLINDMPPASHASVGFKEEQDYGMGKVSVSWHADSGLVENSSIAVLQLVQTRKSSPCDWRIGLRLSPSNETGSSEKVPPISVRTGDGDVYILTGDSNARMEHLVLTGKQRRISSTHRVANTEKDTYQYIQRRVKTAVKRFQNELEKDDAGLDYRVILFSQKVLTEVEMEWIAQYWLQGSIHNQLHTWWHKPMETLATMWEKLEELTFAIYTRSIKKSSTVPGAVLDALLEEFKIRRRQRQLWDERRSDGVYKKRVKEDQRPIARPLFDDRNDRLPKSLSTAINNLARAKASKNPKLRKPIEGHSGKGSIPKSSVSSTRNRKRPSNSTKKQVGNKRKREG